MLPIPKSKRNKRSFPISMLIEKVNKKSFPISMLIEKVNFFNPSALQFSKEKKKK